MMYFLGGPADRQTLALRSAPFFIRAVVNHRGTWDALDQPDDEPKRNETPYCYYLSKPATRVHIRASPRSRSGYYSIGTYRFFPEQPGLDVMRENAVWEDWMKQWQEFAHTLQYPTTDPTWTAGDLLRQYFATLFGDGSVPGEPEF